MPSHASLRDCPAPTAMSRRACLQSAWHMAGAGVACAALSGVANAKVQTPAASPVLGAGVDLAPWTGPLGHFELLDADGKTWRLADLKGRAVLVNFWASWCEPCRAEMPTLQQVADAYGPEQLLVLAVNFKETAIRAQRFAHQTGLGLPVLLDSQGQLASQWAVKVFPTTLTIDRQGRPRHRVRGQLDWTAPAARALIANLL